MTLQEIERKDHLLMSLVIIDRKGAYVWYA